MRKIYFVVDFASMKNIYFFFLDLRQQLFLLTPAGH